MVFDVARPLGARQGEGDVNLLGLIPIGRAVDSEVPNAIGLSGNQFEWAPEYEYAIRDNFAVQFQLPFESKTLDSYRGATQVTFGTAFDNKFIHGAQFVVQYDREPATWLPMALYLAGVRFNDTWSALAMIGVRGDTGAIHAGDRVQRILNITLFADITHTTTFGLETNLADSMSGNASLLVMPQMHWELTDHLLLQLGAGGQFTADGSRGMGGFRLMRSF